MGVMTVKKSSEAINLNRKMRKKMSVVKEGLSVSEVLVQEGIHTEETINSAVAEPVVYMIDHFVIGGFYRVHTLKGKDENLSPYAWSKSKNIELIKNYNKWFNLKYEIVYFYNVYGPGQITKPPMSAVIGIFENQYKNNRPLTIVKPGTQKRDFTHIDDIVKGCYLAWKKGNQNEYMLGTNKTYTILQIAKMFKSKFTFLPQRSGERFGSTMLNNNAQKILGYKAKKSIKDYIKNIISNK